MGGESEGVHDLEDELDVIYAFHDFFVACS